MAVSMVIVRIVFVYVISPNKNLESSTIKIKVTGFGVLKVLNTQPPTRSKKRHRNNKNNMITFEKGIKVKT